MALPSGADVEIGGVGFLLDQGYERITSRRCYVHGGRTILPNRTEIVGNPAGQNFKEGYLVWSLTNFDGEGQVVLDGTDLSSARRFYRSEGLNFRTPGQAKLNKSTIATNVLASTANTTQQGDTFSQVAATFSTSGTDGKLENINAEAKSGADVSYASARPIQADFYLYRDDFADGCVSPRGATVQGSAMVVSGGSGETSGTDLILEPGSLARTAAKSTGTHFDASTILRVEFYFDAIVATDFGRSVNATVFVMDADSRAQVASKTVTISESLAAGTTPKVSLTFDPKAGRSYYFLIAYPFGSKGSASTNADFTIDKVLFGPEITENTATIRIYNETAGSTVVTKTISVTAESAGSIAASIPFYAAISGTAVYRAYVLRASGKQNIWIDKVVWNDPNAAGSQWIIDCVDLGLGSDSSGVFTPFVWAGAHASGVDSQGFTWDFSNNRWNSVVTLNAATTTNSVVRAMAHSDEFEYFLMDSNDVFVSTSGGTDTHYANFDANEKTLVGMAVAQNRLWILSEDGSALGSTVWSVPLDATSGAPYDLDTVGGVDTGVRYVNLPTGTKSPDTSLRQRMCGSPTGARFFINYGDVSAKVYEVDGSGTTLAPRELADLGTGVKATCIAYESGITFVGAQYTGDATASDTDKMPRSVLFAIDQNGVVQRIGFMRKDNPDVRPPQFLVPYQTDLYILQGNYVWRYSLVSGGLFLEYQLNAGTPGEQRALAVHRGFTFAAFEDEVFVTGSVGTYRQASVADGNSITSSVWDFGLPAVTKTLARFDVTSDALASGASIRLEYQTNQSGTWTLAGVHANGSATSFYVTDTNFTTLQVRATLISANGTATPVLRGITIWASSGEDEEYFDLVLLTEDQDSNFRINGEQETGGTKSSHIVNLWRRKAVTTFRDGYSSKETGSEDYLVTIEDLRVEQNALGEGRTVVTLKVVR